MERGPRHDLTLLALLAAVAALYLGRELLMPVALALLVTFSAAPLVERLERRHLGRPAAVVLVCLWFGLLFAGIGWLVAREASEFASSYAQYRTNLADKVEALRAPVGSLSGAAEEITKLGSSIDPKQRDKPPNKVEVVEPHGALGPLGDLVALLAGPLGTAGLVAVLSLFMLLEREELRDRLIWLTGSRDLSLTTQALDDAAQRVSRYLSKQSLVNGSHGLAVAIGLLAIGIPGAALWGALAAVLRFLPYFGPWIAASLPTAVALAAFHGWLQAVLVIGLFVAIELVTNNAIEPWLYGGSVGMSPFGVVLSAVFWGGLWGIPGLLLATPLTVCLVVAGRYVRALEAFPVLLGDQPALSPDVRIYQRLLALDADEAGAVLREAAEQLPCDALSDLVVLSVLRRLAEDDQREILSKERSEELRTRLGPLLDELGARVAAPTEVAIAEIRVLFVPALDANDALAVHWLSALIVPRGIRATEVSPHALTSEIVDRVDAEKPDAICISALTARGLAHARYLAKRLGEDRELIVGCWCSESREVGSGALTVHSTSELDTALQSVRARRAGPEQ